MINPWYYNKNVILNIERWLDEKDRESDGESMIWVDLDGVCIF